MNSFKVVKAYLVKKAQEPIPDSPARQKALEGLKLKQYPGSVSDYFTLGLVTREEALPFALEFLKKDPRYAAAYFKKGLITKEEALPFVLERLKERPAYELEGYLKEGLITKEEAHPFVLEILKKNPSNVDYYFREGLLTQEDALPFVLEILKERPHLIGYYLKEGLITKEEAHPFMLEVLKNAPSNTVAYFKQGMITKEEALPFVLESLKKDPSNVYYYFENGLTTKEEAHPFVLEYLKERPASADRYFEKGLITKEEARPFVLEILKKRPFSVDYYFKAGLITKEEARHFALEILKKDPPYVLDYFIKEFITREEARPFVYKALTGDLNYITSFFEKGLITKEEAHPFVLERLKEAPDRTAFYFGSGLITKEEARPFVLEHLKKDPSRVDYYFKNGLLTKQDVNDFLSGHFSTDTTDFSHAHTLNLEILQKLRSLAKKSGGNITLDKVPQLKKFFSGKPSLSVADIDKMIAREQQQNKHNAYSFDHHIWGSNNMQNSFKQDQLIIKVSALPKALQSEIDSKIYLKKFMDYVKKSTTNHPSPYGWARVHVKDPGVWIIDEIQSDVVSVARSAFREDIPEGLEDHEAEIKAFASKHFAESMRKLILSAVTERAHKAGIDKIEHMNVEFKARQNLSSYGDFDEDRLYTRDQHHQPVKVVDYNGKLADTTKGNVKDSDIPVPTHYVGAYHEGPQKAGFRRDESTGRWVKFSRRK